MIYYKSGYKHQLVKPYHRVCPFLDPELKIVVPFLSLSQQTLYFQTGYAWDGASGPTIDPKSALKPSLVHDGFYQLMRSGRLSSDKYRKPVDDLFYQMLLEGGMFRLRAWIWYRAVRRAAGKYARASEKPVLKAP
jgi:Ser/Thr protein kinase RdoA (MazF antagonist)